MTGKHRQPGLSADPFSINQPEDIVMMIIRTFPDSLIPIGDLFFGYSHQMIGQAYACMLLTGGFIGISAAIHTFFR